MDQTGVTMLLWIAFIAANRAGKRLWFTQKQVAIGFAIFGWIGYTIFDYFVPVEMKTTIIVQIAAAVGTGKVIYDMLNKDV